MIQRECEARDLVAKANIEENHVSITGARDEESIAVREKASDTMISSEPSHARHSLARHFQSSVTFLFCEFLSFSTVDSLALALNCKRRLLEQATDRLSDTLLLSTLVADLYSIQSVSICFQVPRPTIPLMKSGSFIKPRFHQ